MQIDGREVGGLEARVAQELRGERDARVPVDTQKRERAERTTPPRISTQAVLSI